MGMEIFAVPSYVRFILTHGAAWVQQGSEEALRDRVTLGNYEMPQEVSTQRWLNLLMELGNQRSVSQRRVAPGRMKDVGGEFWIGKKRVNWHS